MFYRIKAAGTVIVDIYRSLDVTLRRRGVSALRYVHSFRAFRSMYAFNIGHARSLNTLYEMPNCRVCRAYVRRASFVPWHTTLLPSNVIDKEPLLPLPPPPAAISCVHFSQHLAANFNYATYSITRYDNRGPAILSGDVPF